MSVRSRNPALEDLLVRRGLVTSQDLALLAGEACEATWLADRLVAAGLVTEEQVARAIAEEHELPFVTITRDQIDPALVRRVPSEVLRAHRALPLLEELDTVDVAFADPLDARGLARVEGALRRTVRPAVATSTTILACLAEALGPEGAAAPTTGVDAAWEASGAIRLHALLLACVEEGANELLLVPAVSGGLVRVRRDGVLLDREPLDAMLLKALVARISALVDPGTAPTGRRGFLPARIAGRDLHLTVAVVPTEQGEAASVVIEEESPRADETTESGGLDRVCAFLAGGEGLIVVNSLEPEPAATLLRRARRGAARPLEQWAWCGEGSALDVGPALRLRADAFPTGFSGAVSAARMLRPDVLVLLPRAGTLPPAEAVLGAREGRRVVLLGAWGDAAETAAALAGVGLPPGTLARVLRFVVTLRSGAGGLGAASVECADPFERTEGPGGVA